MLQFRDSEKPKGWLLIADSCCVVLWFFLRGCGVSFGSRSHMAWRPTESQESVNKKGLPSSSKKPRPLAGLDETGMVARTGLKPATFNVTGWTVTYAGGGGYSGSSNGINASAFGNGGILAMYATPTYLAVLKDGSLNLQSDVDVAGADVKVEWLYHTPIYYSGGSGTGGAVWLNTDRSALDAAFPAAPVGTAENWIIATAVPEPSASLLCIVGCLLLLRRSRV